MAEWKKDTPAAVDDAAVLARLKWLALKGDICRGWPDDGWVRYANRYKQICRMRGTPAGKIDRVARMLREELGVPAAAVAAAIDHERAVVERHGPPPAFRPLRAVPGVRPNG